MELYTDVVRQYDDFARYAGDSPCFQEWAEAVADDAEVLAWIGGLPPVKQQPNLVFAAARWHGVPAPGPYEGLRQALLDDDGTIRATILARATQTNEVGRLATLVPWFAHSPGAKVAGRWRCSRSGRVRGCASTPTAGPTAGRPTTARRSRQGRARDCRAR